MALCVLSMPYVANFGTTVSHTPRCKTDTAILGIVSHSILKRFADIEFSSMIEYIGSDSVLAWAQPESPMKELPAITTLLTHASAKEPLGTSAGGPPGAGEGPAEGPGERAVGASVEGDGDGPDMGDGVGEAGVGAGARTGAGEGVGGASVGETVGTATGETVGAATGAWAMHEVAKRANNMNNLHILAEAI
nr:hypothetical protein [Tanacetum cinerariifolium]